MADPSRTPDPPSEPRPPSARERKRRDEGGGLTRVQMGVAIGVGLGLVAIPLFFMGRHGASGSGQGPAASSSSSVDSGEVALALGDGPIRTSPPPPPAAAVPPDAGPGAIVLLSEPRVLSCHDPGPKKTPPNECDRLPAFEQALTKAIEQSASCVVAGSGGGTIVYVGDVSFARKRKPVVLHLPRDGRTVKGSKTVSACGASVKRLLSNFNLEGQHAHTRYKISVVATYPAAPK